jgi:hypothetical protein
MASLDTNLNNFSYWEILDTIFGGGIQPISCILQREFFVEQSHLCVRNAACR